MDRQHKALVHLTGPTGTVAVDGTRLKGVRNVAIRAGLDQDTGPTLTVELALDTALVDGQVVVQVPDDTAAALTALGWTPPA
ncbi:hypothetical protein ACFWM5_00535 [Streptomyces bobili]|uniref:hypothetical protein n=1 Tax=Streptomyces bobili TaxID=67280 RepID=UPI00364D5C47